MGDIWGYIGIYGDIWGNIYGIDTPLKNDIVDEELLVMFNF